MRNAKLDAWVEEVAALCTPDRIRWCDGSDAEYRQLCAELVTAGTLQPLNPTIRPGSSGRRPRTGFQSGVTS